MTSDTEPTLGEVSRQLASLATQMTALGQRLSDDRRDYEAIFVRQREYDIAHRALGRRVDNLEKDAEAKEQADADSRRQLLFMILGAVLTAVLALIVAVILASGGNPT